MVELFGIANCDSMRKARRWLDGHAVVYHFHNYKKEGVDRPLLESWVEQVGWESLLNKRGTTWRKLPALDRVDVDAGKAIALLQAHPSMIKRPLLIHNGAIELGFSIERYEHIFR
ncbi:MAG: ArsC family reductase [Mariprofundus sp.]|nr:ArsC family reductase [Mariprofundus sp.]